MDVDDTKEGVSGKEKYLGNLIGVGLARIIGIIQFA